MGTNYYTKDTRSECVFTDKCTICFDTCGGVMDTVKHIGKASSGWPFITTSYFNNLQELLDHVKSNTIYDEYGMIVSYEDFTSKILTRVSDANIIQDIRDGLYVNLKITDTGLVINTFDPEGWV